MGLRLTGILSVLVPGLETQKEHCCLALPPTQGIKLDGKLMRH